MRRVLAMSAVLAVALATMLTGPHAAYAHSRWDIYDWDDVPVWRAGNQVIFADVDFVGSKTGWAVGSGGTIVHTTTGGHTWLRQTSGTTKYLTSVEFVDANTGWVVGDGGTIRKTTNGGSTWSQQTSGVSDLLESVQFVDAKTGWAVGLGGTILHTDDGGTTWIKQTSGTEDQLSGLHFVDSKTGWAVGGGYNYMIGSEEGLIFHTADGGATWVAQTTGTTNTLDSVHFEDVNTGWAVGSNGSILKTTDGGSLWTTQTCGATSDRLRDVHFTDAENGWVVGTADFGDTIFMTSNGGSTWIRRTTCEPISLNAVYFSSPNVGWAVGGDGTIIHTTNGGVILGDPVAPATMKLNTRYTVYCLFGQDDYWTSAPVRIYKERLVDGRWVPLGYVKAGATETTGKYSVRMSLTSRGKWRLRGVMPKTVMGLGAKSLHYDYVTVY